MLPTNKVVYLHCNFKINIVMMSQMKPNQVELLNATRICFLRVMKNFNMFPYLYRINKDRNRWCSYPKRDNNIITSINVGSKQFDMTRRPSLSVNTHIPQSTYDMIVAMVNEFVRNIIEPYKEHRIDVAKFGEELFNQIGYRLFGDYFVEDMKILDNAMGNVQMPTDKESFNRFLEQCKYEYDNSNLKDEMDFTTFVNNKLYHKF